MLKLQDKGRDWKKQSLVGTYAKRSLPAQQRGGSLKRRSLGLVHWQGRHHDKERLVVPQSKSIVKERNRRAQSRPPQRRPCLLLT